MHVNKEVNGMLWLIVYVYIALALGFYFKTYTINADFPNRKMAFYVPIIWVETLMSLFFADKKHRKLILYMLLHPYTTMFACCLVYTMQPASVKISIKIKKRSANATNDVFQEKLQEMACAMG